MNIADFMTSAQTVNATASNLLKKDSPTDSADVVKQVNAVVNSYNAMAAQAKNSSSYMNSAIMKRITNSLNAQQLEQLGIQKGANGQLHLDQAKLGRNLNERFDQTTKALTSTVQTIKKETGRIDDLPASAMLSKSMNKLQLLRGLYNSGSGTSLFSSTSGTPGLLINTRY
ncbi:flagellar filament capping protein FliD [Paenibacillus sp. MMS20-IR301]|uniref:flagellar filament capping protein FliD n=1 Tax=Paenibacillus sp. MMS20-IR301 TaxID=2895946 RepID=UPI0028E4BAB8|nr:flagellar filament capping protein FliD [Paenibacillus sp. MMS20-IR301]WNS43716.1 flagellar filament capping protein FliD [Paenibacillus sp. MMS20-IR301]